MSGKLTGLDFLRKLLLVQFLAKSAENGPKMVFFAVFKIFYLRILWNKSKMKNHIAIDISEQTRRLEKLWF